MSRDLAPGLDPDLHGEEYHVGAGTLSGALAEFGHMLRLEAVPSAVTAHAKLLLLDTLGAALAGVDTAEGRAVAAAARRFAGERGPCAVWGTRARTTRAAAALVNGTVAHAQELDDFGGCDHSGAVVIPAVLAACEGRRPSGARILEAIIVGYDVALRCLEAAGGYRAHNGRGWHSTGTCGSFGAAAAVAKVLGLGALQTAWAIGLAGSFTGGTWAFLGDGAMSKRYHPGRAAETGVIAGFLAEAGFTGPGYVLEAGWGGFLPVYAAEDARPEKIRDGLGTDFKILRSGVKPYACCRDIHSVLDFVLDLRRREALAADAVEGIEVRCPRGIVQMLGNAAPATRLAAQMSMPYGIAVAWMTGRALVEEYEDRWLADAGVRAFIPRVKVTADAALAEGTEPYITVTARDGRRFAGRVPFARGAPENPLPYAEVAEKYNILASRALPAAEVARLKDAVLSLEDRGAASEMLALLGRRRSRRPGRRRTGRAAGRAARRSARS
ncbi:MAG: MmgE/PrpD family protein [bacterium]